MDEDEGLVAVAISVALVHDFDPVEEDRFQVGRLHRMVVPGDLVIGDGRGF